MFKVQGRLFLMGVQKSGVSAKTGNTWCSQDIVIDYQDENGFARKMTLVIFNKQFDLKIGNMYSIDFSIDGKEYQGRYFNTLNVINMVEEHYIQPPVNQNVQQQKPNTTEGLVF